jgi:hypothetical protein
MDVKTICTNFTTRHVRRWFKSGKNATFENFEEYHGIKDISGGSNSAKSISKAYVLLLLNNKGV